MARGIAEQRPRLACTLSNSASRGLLILLPGAGGCYPADHGRALWWLFGRVLACSPRELGEDSRGSGAFARRARMLLVRVVGRRILEPKEVF